MATGKKKNDTNISSSIQEAFLIGIGVADIAVSRMKKEIYQLLRNNNIDTQQAREMASRLIDDVETRKEIALRHLNEKSKDLDSLVSEFLAKENKKPSPSEKSYSKSVRKKTPNKPTTKTSKKDSKKSASRRMANKKSAKKPTRRKQTVNSQKKSTPKSARKRTVKKTAGRTSGKR